MISLYSGTPGSGKSLHVARLLFERDKKELVTIGNFDINKDLLLHPQNYFSVENEDLTPQFLYEFSVNYFSDHKYKEGLLLVVIDEAQLIFNSRDWNRKDRNLWIKFFTQHRKLGFNIIMVAQFDKMLDKQIRCLFEYEYVHRKISNFGAKGKLLSIWSGNKLFIAVKFWYPLKQKVGSQMFTYKRRFGDLYDTNFIFNSFVVPSLDVSDEQSSDKGIVFVDF